MISRSNIFDRPETLSGAKGQTGNTAGNPICIWMVDDNETFRSLLAELLAYEEGFLCARQFPSAEAVLEALPNDTPPDIMLLDIQMGGQSGLDAVRPIKSLARSTKVLMLTTFYDSHARDRATRDGATDLLLKSYSVEEIAQRIRQAHERPGEQPGELSETASMTGMASGCKDDDGERLKAQCCADDEELPTCVENNFRDRSWRGASNRLARGVSYLRALLRTGRVSQQSNEAVDPLRPVGGIDSISE